MKIIKTLEVGLDIPNPISFFSSPEENLLRLLKLKFENKCFRACYINDVLRIIKYSEPMIDQEQSQVFAKVNIMFEVLATIYNPGDIINGCVVKKNDKSGVIFCQTDNAAIWIKSTKILQSVKVDQLISIRVGQTRYDIGSTKVSVNAMPFTLNTTAPIYAIDTANFTENDQRAFNFIIDQIKEEEAEGEIVKKKLKPSWDFFEKLLYAFKTEKPLSTGVKHTLYLDSVKGWFSRDPKLQLSTPQLCYYAAKPTADISEHVDRAAYLALLEDYLAHIRTIREMTSIYKDSNLIESHKNIWTILIKSKDE